MSNLTPVIKSIQDVMRQDAGINGDAQRIEQLVWLLFLKVFDALEEELELTRDGYRSPIPERLRWRHWAADAEGITGDALLDFVNSDLFPHAEEPAGRPAAQPARLGGARRLRGRQQLHEERPAAAAGDQQARRDRLQPPGRAAPVQRPVREDPARPAERRQCRRVLHAARRDPVHGRHGRTRSWARRCSTRPAAPAAFWSAPSSTCAGR